MFKPVNINEIPAKRKSSKYAQIVNDFMFSGYDAVEIDLEELGETASKATANFHAQAIKYGCKSMIRQGRLFLVKEGVKC